MRNAAIGHHHAATFAPISVSPQIPNQAKKGARVPEVANPTPVAARNTKTLEANWMWLGAASHLRAGSTQVAPLRQPSQLRAHPADCSGVRLTSENCQTADKAGQEFEGGVELQAQRVFHESDRRRCKCRLHASKVKGGD